MRARFAGAVTALAAVFLTGCVGIGSTAPRNASFVEHFSLEGRLNVRAPERSDTVRLVWVRRGGGDESIQLFTPFGSQLAQITVEGGRATLTRGKESESAASIADLLASVLGVRVDTTAIARWVQGVGLDDTGATEDQGFRITATEFTTRNGTAVASRVVATRGHGEAALTLRILVDNFQTP